MSRENDVYLQDILESILAVENYVKDLTPADFRNNQIAQDAVIRRFEIIGEAAKNINENFKNEHPDIPWREAAGMRDILIHEYFGVNLNRVWGTIQKDLPLLKEKLLKITRKS